MSDWRRALLKRMGAPATPANLRFLSSWQRWEGGHTNNDASFNWLNTTHGPGRSINSVGVRAFGDFQTGIRSTMETLMNGRYDDIVAGLTSGNPYDHDLTAGLSTWVSGSPTGGGDYASRILGGKAGKPGKAEASRPSVSGRPTVASAPSGGSVSETLRAFRGDTGDRGSRTSASPRAHKYSFYRGRLPKSYAAAAAGGAGGAAVDEHGHVVSEWKGGHGGLFVPYTPTGTHVSDGLGWGTKTAQDIMADPDTDVLAPGSGTVVYWHPEGAQGGGSMLIRLDNGREFWLGHIAHGVRAGTRFKKGTRLASISSDHPRPHLHVDAR